MNTPRLRISLTAALICCATAAAATPAWADVPVFYDYGPNNGRNVPTANPPSDPENVRLLGDGFNVGQIGDQSVNLRNLLDNFQDGYYSGTGDFVGNGHSINYDADALSGELFITNYQALSGGEDHGDAYFTAQYFPGPTDPPISQMRFIQMITTNDPLPGSSPQGQRIDTNSAVPFYPWPQPRISPNGQVLLFTDYPGRNCRPPHYPGADNIRWSASLLLASYDGTELDLFRGNSGVLWGFTMICPPNPARPADVQHLAAALLSPGDVYTVNKTAPPIEYTVVPNNRPIAQITLSQASLVDVSTVSMTQNGSDEIYTLNALLGGQMSANGGQPTPVQLSGQMQIIVFNRTGEAEGEFSTQMTALDLTSTADLPGYGPVTLTLRESTALSSTGSAEDVGTLLIDNSDHLVTDGTSPFNLSSFFDIFTELSLDGGQTFAPSIGGAMEFDLVPEPGSLALAGIGGIGLAMLSWRRPADRKGDSHEWHCRKRKLW